MASPSVAADLTFEISTLEQTAAIQTQRLSFYSINIRLSP